MSYSLHYFIRKTSTRYQLTQLAGNAGLHADISWVYLMEDIENTDFLRGGELVITTGMSIHSEQTRLCCVIKKKTGLRTPAQCRTLYHENPSVAHLLL